MGLVREYEQGPSGEPMDNKLIFRAQSWDGGS